MSLKSDTTKTQRKAEGMTRRGFLGFAFAGFLTFLLWLIRRSDLPMTICKFFGLHSDHRFEIARKLKVMEKANPQLRREVALFFTLARVHQQKLLARQTQIAVIDYWSRTLFDKRSISWPYTGYPSVEDLPICSGLIRKPA